MEQLLESLLYVLWRGIAIGIMISAPMGPVGILCIQRTLNKGRLTGLYTGIGAAISDIFYCLLTGFGLSFIEDFLTRNQSVIQLLGSAVLIGFAIYLLKKNPAASLRANLADTGSTPHKDILGGFLFTFSNPLILFLIVGLFARFNFLDAGLKWYNYVVGYIAIALGALGWWWIVTFSIDKVRSHFNVRSMWLINRIIGAVIMIFGLVGLVTGTMAIFSSEASAAEYHPGRERVTLPTGETIICSNPDRGFAAWGEDISSRESGDDSPLILTSSGQPEAIWSVESLYEDSLSYHMSYHKGALTAPFVLSGRLGQPRGAEGWRMRLEGGKGMEITVRPSRIDYRDPFAPEGGLEVEIADFEGCRIARKQFDKADVSGESNCFILARQGQNWSLTVGNRPGSESLRFVAESHPHSIRLFPAGKKELRIDYLNLHLRPEPASDALIKGEITGWRDKVEAMEEDDGLSGEWSVLDRELDEALLRSGGDYVICILPDGEGWTGYYLSGARVNPDLWHPGDVKLRLRPGVADGLYKAQWTASDGTVMAQDITASHDSEAGLLTILFPYQQSTLRLIRTE